MMATWKRADWPKKGIKYYCLNVWVNQPVWGTFWVIDLDDKSRGRTNHFIIRQHKDNIEQYLKSIIKINDTKKVFNELIILTADLENEAVVESIQSEDGNFFLS